MPDQDRSTRYSAAQLVEAIGRARGDGRYFLVRALTNLPGPEREHALARVLDAELRADERHMVRRALARSRPDTYLRPLLVEGLRSRSINVQQMVVAGLPSLVGDGLEAAIADELESWLRKRLKSPGRANTWALWEVPGIALSLLPARGPVSVWELLQEISPQMQPEERERHRAVQEAGDDTARIESLRTWFQENIWGAAGDLDVDRDPNRPGRRPAMKRLGLKPVNPGSATYDDLHDDLHDDEARLEVSVHARPSRRRRRRRQTLEALAASLTEKRNRP